VDRRPEVVDDDPGTMLRQLQGMAPPNPVAGTGDDGDLFLQ
jgi:hypothetical protein